jgi:uncharacterized membrane protein YhdT
MSHVFTIYLALCLMVGYLGRKSKLGGIRSFLLSCLLTPIFMLVFLLLFASIEQEKTDTDSNKMKDC